MAQYYHLTDLSGLTVKQQAVLACGLPPESRTMKELSGIKYDTKTLLLAGILDEAKLLVYSKTKSARNGQNRPKSVLTAMLEDGKGKSDKSLKTFESGQSFDAYRRRLIEGMRNGN